MTIKCGIINNDALTINMIKSYIDKIPDTELVLSSQNAIDNINQIQKNTIDLLFLDVNFPDISGLELLQTLVKPPKIIITASKKKYAADAFEHEVLDYIVKPFPFQRFLSSINKYRKQCLLMQNSLTVENYFFLKENKKMVKVELSDILYVESIKDYIKVATSKKTVVTKQQIGHFYSKLPSSNFIRPHRSFLININKIEAYSNSIIEIAGIKFPIGRNYKEDCLTKLAKINQRTTTPNLI